MSQGEPRRARGSTGGLVLAVLVSTAPAVGCARPAPPVAASARVADSTRDPYNAARVELGRHLDEDLLATWLPRLVDERSGGFGPRRAYDWSPSGSDRFLVFQARMTWFAARVAASSPDRRHGYLAYAEHGVRYLRERMWDPEAGGLFWNIEEDGTPRLTEKHAYGMAFAIFAAAATARVSGDSSALDLARATFSWLDEHAHDAEHGGYFEALDRAGRAILRPTEGRPHDAIGTPYGQKSMNTHLHLLEAFTELVRAAHDERARERLAELYRLFQDRIASPDGYLNVAFEPDWTPASRDDSYGHDLEAAFLLAEAAEALGVPGDPKMLVRARQLVDHALDFGWDEARGGFFDGGPPNAPPSRREKIWWVQAEAMNALLWMHERDGRPASRYGDAFLATWSFSNRYLVDHARGDWLWSVTPDGVNAAPEREKAGAWKDPYHQGRAVLNCLERLTRLAGGGDRSRSAHP